MIRSDSGHFDLAVTLLSCSPGLSYSGKKLNEKYTACEILSTLRAMKLLAIEGLGYQPAYTRTDITDDLHEAFGFYTDYEIMKKNKIRTIIHQTKQKQA